MDCKMLDTGSVDRLDCSEFSVTSPRIVNVMFA